MCSCPKPTSPKSRSTAWKRTLRRWPPTLRGGWGGGWRSAPSAGVDVANWIHGRRFVAWSWQPDGSLSIRGRLPAEDGAAFVEMIETAAAAIHGTSAPPGFAATADEEISGKDSGGEAW